MILDQKRTLVPAADVGAPGPLPPYLRGLSDASLADLPAALSPGATIELDLANTGYVPGVIPDPVVFRVLTRPQLILGLKAVNCERPRVACRPTTRPRSISRRGPPSGETIRAWR